MSLGSQLLNEQGNSATLGKESANPGTGPQRLEGVWRFARLTAPRGVALYAIDPCQVVEVDAVMRNGEETTVSVTMLDGGEEFNVQGPFARVCQEIEDARNGRPIDSDIAYW